MHEKVLPDHSLELLNDLEKADAPALRGWRLAGGTGLALRMGHRVSEDFDFLRTDEFDVPFMRETLLKYGEVEMLQEDENTLTVLLRGVKMSFFRARDPFLFEGTPYRFFSIADIRDIALMKLAAISGRGSRKDFVDLHIILRHPPSLEDYFELLPEKYGVGRWNAYHILKSLTYFDDAETEPMPRMTIPFDWEECKAFFVRSARGIVLG